MLPSQDKSAQLWPAFHMRYDLRTFLQLCISPWMQHLYRKHELFGQARKGFTAAKKQILCNSDVKRTQINIEPLLNQTHTQEMTTICAMRVMCNTKCHSKCTFQTSTNASLLQYVPPRSCFCNPLPSRRHPTAIHIHQPIADLAATLDTAPVWTLDQIAGLVFGGLLVAFYFSSQYIDKYVAKSQRRQLGLCEECGGVNDAATCQSRTCPLKKQ